MRNWTITLLSILGLFIIESCQNDGATSNNTQHHSTETQSPSAEKNYMSIGKELALQTKAALGDKLSKAIAANGFAGAVEFCNIKAIPITDSLSRALNAKINRVSDRPRNTANQAKEGELFYIDMCKQALAEGKELKPFISEDDIKMIGYYPIVTNQMCLNCHGDSKSIGVETLAKINSLYPTDQAKGYKDNELRGIFVVKIDK